MAIVSFNETLIDDHLVEIGSHLQDVDLLCFILTCRRTFRLMREKWKPSFEPTLAMSGKSRPFFEPLTALSWLYCKGSHIQITNLMPYFSETGRVQERAWVGFLQRIIDTNGLETWTRDGFDRETHGTLTPIQDLSPKMQWSIICYCENLNIRTGADNAAQFVAALFAFFERLGLLARHIFDCSKCGDNSTTLPFIMDPDMPPHIGMLTFRDDTGLPLCWRCSHGYRASLCSSCGRSNWDARDKPVDDLSLMFPKPHTNMYGHTYDHDAFGRCPSCVAAIYLRSVDPAVLDDIIRQSLQRMGK